MASEDQISRFLLSLHISSRTINGHLFPSHNKTIRHCRPSQTAVTRSQFPSDCSLSNLTGQSWNNKHACHSASRHWMESQPGHFHKLWNRQNWNIPGVGLDAQVPIIGHKHNIPLNGDWLVRCSQPVDKVLFTVMQAGG